MNLRYRSQIETVKDCPFSAQQIREANKRFDRHRNELPPEFVPVPKGFSKALDNDELNALVMPYHADLIEQERQSQITKQLADAIGLYPECSNNQ